MGDSRVRYARNGDVRLAYREFGHGDTTLAGAEFKTVADGPHGMMDNTLGAAIIDFVTGRRGVAVDERVLKTVLFTDIVSSTELLSARGDAPAMGGPGEVLSSRTVRDLSAGSGLRFDGLGAHHLKGLPEDTEVFRVSTPAGGPTA